MKGEKLVIKAWVVTFLKTTGAAEKFKKRRAVREIESVDGLPCLYPTKESTWLTLDRCYKPTQKARAIRVIIVEATP